MIFRSVTYHADELDFSVHKWMVLNDYTEQPSGSWDVCDVPVSKLYRMDYRNHGRFPIVSIQLDLTVARKSRFYVMTFLLPCVCIALLTIFIFYLPIASGEKLCLAISILFSIAVFLLILKDILPPSDSLPLMTKFLFFAFICNFLSVVTTTIIVNWSFRTHPVPNWIRVVFLQILPILVCIKRPVETVYRKPFSDSPVVDIVSKERSFGKLKLKTASETRLKEMVEYSETATHRNIIPRDNNSSYARSTSLPKLPIFDEQIVVKELNSLGNYLQTFPGYADALQKVAFIAEHQRNSNKSDMVGSESATFVSQDLSIYPAE